MNAKIRLVQWIAGHDNCSAQTAPEHKEEALLLSQLFSTDSRAIFAQKGKRENATVTMITALLAYHSI